MPVPLPVLLAAAERVLSDERTQTLGKAMWRKGSELWDKRSETRPPSEPAPEDDAPAKPSAGFLGWRKRVGMRRLRKGQQGDLLKFTYTDEHGLETTRLIGNWSSDGAQLSGYCLNRREICEFEIRRIGDWREVEV